MGTKIKEFMKEYQKFKREFMDSNLKQSSSTTTDDKIIVEAYKIYKNSDKSGGTN